MGARLTARLRILIPPISVQFAGTHLIKMINIGDRVKHTYMDFGPGTVISTTAGKFFPIRVQFDKGYLDTFAEPYLIVLKKVNGKIVEEVKKDNSLETKFNDFVITWKRATSNIPSIRRRLKHNSYQEIINLGKPVLPLLLKEMESNPDHWMVALSVLSGANPVPKNAAEDVKRAAQLWIEWGKKAKLI